MIFTFLSPRRSHKIMAAVFLAAMTLTISILGSCRASFSVTPAKFAIHVDQFGYRPDDLKVAVIAEPAFSSQGVLGSFATGSTSALQDSYQLLQLPSQTPVYTATPEIWQNGAVHEQSGDRAAWFDFSSVQQPGNYVIQNIRTKDTSPPFRIAEDVYRDALIAATRMYFYQRSGFPKHEPYADPRWTDDAAFLGSGQDLEARFIDDKDNLTLVRDVSGGWFDAGDTNKYVTFAAQPLHQMLDAYTQNPSIWTDDFNIPESGNGIPDLIDEILFEINWFRRMQEDDGGTLIKVGTIDYNSAEKPSLDRRPRYYAGQCSSATIALAGVFAHAADVFKTIPSLKTTTEDLTNRANLAWDWFMSHPIQTDCDSQEIKAGDADRTEPQQISLAVTAAVYLSVLDSQPAYHDYIRQHADETRPFTDPAWSLYEAHVGNALLAYTKSLNAKPDLKQWFKDALTERMQWFPDVYGTISNIDAYRAYMPDDQYHWGSNAIKSHFGNSNYNALLYGIDYDTPEGLKERALGVIHYLHGVNPLGIVYLTNMYDYGVTYSANEMYHEWFGHGIYKNAKTSSSGPAPGYLTGGPNKNYSGSAPLADLPPMRAYLDKSDGDLRMWEITEPSIGYQSAYLKLLSNFQGSAQDARIEK